jgi:hypothetical protein
VIRMDVVDTVGYELSSVVISYSSHLEKMEQAAEINAQDEE